VKFIEAELWIASRNSDLWFVCPRGSSSKRKPHNSAFPLCCDPAGMLVAHRIMRSLVRSSPLRAARFKSSNAGVGSPTSSSTNQVLRSPVPAIGVFVGCCGFAFQVSVLYPWHEILGEQFKHLEEEVRGSRKELESLKQAVLTGNEKIVELQAEVRDLKRDK